MTLLNKLHKTYIESRDLDDNYNYDDPENKPEENEFTIWHPVANPKKIIIKEISRER